MRGVHGRGRGVTAPGARRWQVLDVGPVEVVPVVAVHVTLLEGDVVALPHGAVVGVARVYFDAVVATGDLIVAVPGVRGAAVYVQARRVQPAVQRGDPYHPVVLEQVVLAEETRSSTRSRPCSRLLNSMVQ